MNMFGNHEHILKHDHENGMFEKHIRVKKDAHFSADYHQQAHHLNQLTSYLKKEKAFGVPEATAPKNLTCQSNRSGPADPTAQFMFLPAYTGNLSPENPMIKAEGTCFKNVTMMMEYSEE